MWPLALSAGLVLAAGCASEAAKPAPQPADATAGAGGAAARGACGDDGCAAAGRGPAAGAV